MAGKRGVVMRWLVTLMIIAVGTFLVWRFIVDRPKAVYESPVAPVKVAKPYRADLDVSLTLNGYIEAKAMIPVVPFVQGTITGYYARSGDLVQEGQVLAQIDPEPYELQLKQAEAMYLASEATFRRVSGLFSTGAATRQSYDEAKAAFDAYKAQYDLANIQLGYATVTAPKGGTILVADGAEGAIASSSSPLYVIADLDRLQINLDVPERYFSLIHENRDGMKAIVSREDVSVIGSVETVSPYVSPESKTFKVTIDLEGDLSRLRPGMHMRIDLVYRSYSNALALDQLTRNTDGSAYYFDPDTGCARHVMLDVIAQDNERFIIDESWADTLFIVDGQGSVLDGQRVNVL